MQHKNVKKSFAKHIIGRREKGSTRICVGMDWRERICPTSFITSWWRTATSLNWNISDWRYEGGGRAAMAGGGGADTRLRRRAEGEANGGKNTTAPAHPSNQRIWTGAIRHRRRVTPSKKYCHPMTTSSTIIKTNPMAKPMVLRLLCWPAEASGISSSTTTYNMAPAAKAV